MAGAQEHVQQHLCREQGLVSSALQPEGPLGRLRLVGSAWLWERSIEQLLDQLVKVGQVALEDNGGALGCKTRGLLAETQAPSHLSNRTSASACTIGPCPPDRSKQ